MLFCLNEQLWCHGYSKLLLLNRLIDHLLCFLLLTSWICSPLSTEILAFALSSLSNFALLFIFFYFSLPADSMHLRITFLAADAIFWHPKHYLEYEPLLLKFVESLALLHCWKFSLLILLSCLSDSASFICRFFFRILMHMRYVVSSHTVTFCCMIWDLLDAI